MGAQRSRCAQALRLNCSMRSAALVSRIATAVRAVGGCEQVQTMPYTQRMRRGRDQSAAFAALWKSRHDTRFMLSLCACAHS